MNPALMLPSLTLQYEPAGPAAALEKPVQLRLGAITHADGQAATPAELRKIGAFVYRSASAGGAEEMWNEDEQAWKPAVTEAAALAALTPLALAARPGDPQPWQGVLVAAGQKDQAGAPRYAAAVNGAPVYRLRVFAQFSHGGGLVQALGAASADLRFVSATENQRFRISFGAGESADDCTLARLQLKSAALLPTGFIELRASGAELEIAKCDASGQPLARLLLNADGDIELQPAPGRRLLVHGDLEAERIRYQPAGSGIKKDLL